MARGGGICMAAGALAKANANVEPSRLRCAANAATVHLTNFLVNASLSPVPFGLFRSFVGTWRNSSKIKSWCSSAIPVPLSITEISTESSIL